MSSLKDIMDVDVEPLESQAYRRSKEAAEQQASHRTTNPLSATPSPPLDDSKGKAPLKRRRSNRVAKAQGEPAASRSNGRRRRSSATSDAMDYTPGYQAGGSAQASTSGSPRHSSRGSEPATEMPVKYTPVTGRISRAKKGVPVHTCEICRPVKTFTRAEHLRRHQLSHQKPAYPCTFEDCERTFHRPDLLARHLNRHETQGEKAYKSGDRRSRASSSESENHEAILNVETQGMTASASQVSSANSTTPRTSVANAEGSKTASSVGPITGSFQTVNISGSSENTPSSISGAGHSRSGTSRPPSNYEQMTSSFSVRPTTESVNQETYSGRYSTGPSFKIHPEADNLPLSDYPTSHALPLLRIPEEPCIPGLSYTQENSPWCSSASDSTFSTQSDRVRHGRSASVATIPDWSAPALATQWPPNISNTSSQDHRSSPFDAIMENFGTPFASPGMSPSISSPVLLDIPNSFGGYYMESVGTLTLSTYNKLLAQLFPASPSRVSNSGLASAGRGSKELVGSQLGDVTTCTMASGPLSFPQFESYLLDYWRFFEPVFPIIHRQSFDSDPEPLLTAAMVSLGAQYSDRPEARKFGMNVHEYCRQNIDLCRTWSLQTMQAILLTEIFQCFHGKKINVRCSRQFEELYSRLIRESYAWQTQPGTQSLQHNDPDAEWAHWIDAEARRRLLSGCFIFDTHQSMYHEQNRSNAQQLDPMHSLICIPCPESQWNARNSTEWQAQRPEPATTPLRLVEQRLSQQQNAMKHPHFTKTMIICSLTSQLPPRRYQSYGNELSLPSAASNSITRLVGLFPTSTLANTYLALYHTPLHDLLAVAGDTWVFGRKITPPSAFNSAKLRLKSWSSSLMAVVATQHACQVLHASFSDHCDPFTRSNREQNSGNIFISEYWSLYILALICWAFGHRYQSTTGGSGSISKPNSSSALTRDTDCDSREVARAMALKYTSAMMALSAKDLLSNKIRIRGDTNGVIDTVRAKLEIDGIGGLSMTVVDAMGVLKRIRESGRGKWF